MTPNLVTVFTAAGQMQASLIKSFLEAHGIPTLVVQESAGVVYGLTVGLMGNAEILVAEEHAQEARELLEAMERGELTTDNENDAES